MDLWDAGALGMVEARGLAASIVAVDVMAKAAEVRVIGVRRVGGGLVAVSFTGDMASVTAAVESARQAVAAVGGTIAATVIGRPAVPTDFLRDPDAVPPDGATSPDVPPDGATSPDATPDSAAPAGDAPVGDAPGGEPTAQAAPAGDAPAGDASGAGAPVPRPARTRTARSTSPKRGTPRPSPGGGAPAAGGPPVGEPPPEPPTRRPRGK